MSKKNEKLTYVVSLSVGHALDSLLTVLGEFVVMLLQAIHFSALFRILRAQFPQIQETWLLQLCNDDVNCDGGETSLTEFRHQIRSGDLLAYLYLNGLSNGIVSCSKCYFVLIQPGNLISQKFNSCVMDRPMDGRTDRHIL